MDLEKPVNYQAPLTLIDRITSQSDKEIVALKQVSASELYFQGHFPGNTVMPGVLIVQTMVEAIELWQGRQLQLAKMRKVKFREMVQPGESLIIKVTCKDPKKMIFSGQAFLNEKVACSAELVFLD